jgi:mycothiol synthase
MSPSTAVPVERLARLAAGDVARIRALADEVAAADGSEPLSDDGRLRLADPDQPVHHFVVRDVGDSGISGGVGGGPESVVGYAQLVRGETGTDDRAELLVASAARRRGIGRALAEALLSARDGDPLQVWAHGRHPGAVRLAEILDFAAARELWQMRLPLDHPLPDPVLPAGLTVRTFVPGEDEDAWLALNAAAFATHPEQGRWTEHDLRLREAEPWFDPAGFFLAERDGRLVGFHWTKTHGATLGEVYVLGVDPAASGGGLGTLLTLVGLRSLQARGLEVALLYVEATNPAAIRVYTRLGFTQYSVDVNYRHS